MFIIVLAIFTLIILLVPKFKFEGAALTLFSVNSFLYGFYIAPILSGQKARIDELQKLVRTESSNLFAIMIKAKHLDRLTYLHLKNFIKDYLEENMARPDANHGEEQYQVLINYCLEYHGVDETKIEKITEQLVSNEAQRAQITMQINNKIFNNEWWIIFVLFSITISFVGLIDIGNGIFLKTVQIFLCTGLSMLLVILYKLTTLTHKKAKSIWEPYTNLINTNFHKI
jgi:hypothetical protein